MGRKDGSWVGGRKAIKKKGWKDGQMDKEMGRCLDRWKKAPRRNGRWEGGKKDRGKEMSGEIKDERGRRTKRTAGSSELRTLTDFPEDQGSSPNTHMAAHSCV